MGIFTKKIGPVFIKENSYIDEYIKEMEQLKSDSTESFKEQIDEKIKFYKWGKKGEDSTAYQLRTSGLDMYILHDLYFESENANAQIDFLVITRKNIYILECKYLSGNIEIDSLGNFKRTKIANSTEPEGMESPITQNEKHLLVLKEACRQNKANTMAGILSNTKLSDRLKPLFVLANPKTYLEANNADSKIKNQVVRADRLVAYITENDAVSKGLAFNDKKMYELARFFLSKGTLKKSYHEVQCNRTIQEFKASYIVEKKEHEEALIKRLKNYRLEKSRSEDIPAYFIFKDEQLENLIKYKPSTIPELLKVPGFGKVKAEKYGKEILKILNGDG